MRHIQGHSREHITLFPESLDDYITDDHPVRFLDAFVNAMDLQNLGFKRAVPEETGRPPCDPADLPKRYLYGYLNRIRSSRQHGPRDLPGGSRRPWPGSRAMIWNGRPQGTHKPVCWFRRIARKAPD